MPFQLYKKWNVNPVFLSMFPSLNQLLLLRGKGWSESLKWMGSLLRSRCLLIKYNVFIWNRQDSCIACLLMGSLLRSRCLLIKYNVFIWNWQDSCIACLLALTLRSSMQVYLLYLVTFIHSCCYLSTSFHTLNIKNVLCICRLVLSLTLRIFDMTGPKRLHHRVRQPCLRVKTNDQIMFYEFYF